MEIVVYLDGKFLPQSEAKVTVFDHGLLYGDGVFEGIRAYNKRVFKLERHVERMYQSAKAIDLAIPHTPEEFTDLILQTCRRNNIVDGYIRPIVTRGPGDLGLDPRKCKRGPTVVIIAQPGITLYPKEKYEKGLRLVTSSYRRVPPQSLSPSIKRSRLNTSADRGSTSRSGRAPSPSACTYAGSRGVFRHRRPSIVETAPTPIPR